MCIEIVPKDMIATAKLEHVIQSIQDNDNDTSILLLIIPIPF